MEKWNLYGINFFYDDEFHSEYSEPEEEVSLVATFDSEELAKNYVSDCTEKQTEEGFVFHYNSLLAEYVSYAIYKDEEDILSLPHNPFLQKD